MIVDCYVLTSFFFPTHCTSTHADVWYSSKLNITPNQRLSRSINKKCFMWVITPNPNKVWSPIYLEGLLLVTLKNTSWSIIASSNDLYIKNQITFLFKIIFNTKNWARVLNVCISLKFIVREYSIECDLRKLFPILQESKWTLCWSYQ